VSTLARGAATSHATDASTQSGYADIKASDVQTLDVGCTPQLPLVADQDNGKNTPRSCVRKVHARECSDPVDSPRFLSRAADF
jgi:hypothetical protein